MTLSMYQAFVPVCTRALANLSAILDKGLASAEARGVDPAVLINDRIAPDMYPLSRQVQIASDISKGGAARLAGVEAPSFPDTETSFPELKARIEKTIAFLNSVPADQIDGTEARQIVLKFPSGDIEMAGQPYLLNFVLPNLFFHCTAAYLILRHNGVGVGKMDFIGGV